MLNRLSTQGEGGGQPDEELKDGSSYSVASSEFDDLKLDDRKIIGDYFSFHPKRRSVVGNFKLALLICVYSHSFVFVV